MSSGLPTSYPGRPAKRLTLRISVHDHRRHKSLQIEILKRARKAKLAGATVFEGEQGFGESGHLHREHLLSDDRPLAIVIVDQPDKIDGFLDQIGPLLDGVVATTEQVEILDLWSRPTPEP